MHRPNISDLSLLFSILAAVAIYPDLPGSETHSTPPLTTTLEIGEKPGCTISPTPHRVNLDQQTVYLWEQCSEEESVITVSFAEDFNHSSVCRTKRGIEDPVKTCRFINSDDGPVVNLAMMTYTTDANKYFYPVLAYMK